MVTFAFGLCAHDYSHILQYFKDVQKKFPPCLFSPVPSSSSIFPPATLLFLLFINKFTIIISSEEQGRVGGSFMAHISFLLLRKVQFSQNYVIFITCTTLFYVLIFHIVHTKQQ